MSDFHGIIFAYGAVPALGELVRRRTASSLPFCGRYRLIDFALSSLMNAGIHDVGVISRCLTTLPAARTGTWAEE